MTLMDESVWRGKIYSGEWVDGTGGDAPVVEPATGREIGRAGREIGRTGREIDRTGRATSGTGAGFGRTANLEAFTDTRRVTIRGDIAPYPFQR
jgi:hypothetical protein